GVSHIPTPQATITTLIINIVRIIVLTIGSTIIKYPAIDLGKLIAKNILR
ncbi:ABC-type bacteriocin/lantibiotic exporter with double-glycine peptidase domain, partial [Pedobacter sp. CG_S7]